MPIIINEFEIIPDATPGQSPAPAQPPAASETAPAPEPDDIVRVQRVHVERMRRVRAD
jgi:hypothetical protein